MNREENEILIFAPLPPDEMIWAIKPLLEFARKKKQQLHYEKAIIACPSYPILNGLFCPRTIGDPIVNEFRPCPSHWTALQAFAKSDLAAIKGRSKTIYYLDRKKIREICGAHDLHYSQAVYHVLGMPVPEAVVSTSLKVLLNDELSLSAFMDREMRPCEPAYRPIFFAPPTPEYRPPLVHPQDWLQVFGYIAQGKHQTVAVPEIFCPWADDCLAFSERFFLPSITSITELAFWMLYSGFCVGEHSWLTQLAVGLNLPTVIVAEPLPDCFHVVRKNLHYCTVDPGVLVPHDAIVQAAASLSTESRVR